MFSSFSCCTRTNYPNDKEERKKHRTATRGEAGGKQKKKRKVMANPFALCVLELALRLLVVFCCRWLAKVFFFFFFCLFVFYFDPPQSTQATMRATRLNWTMEERDTWRDSKYTLKGITKKYGAHILTTITPHHTTPLSPSHMTWFVVHVTIEPVLLVTRPTCPQVR